MQETATETIAGESRERLKDFSDRVNKAIAGVVVGAEETVRQMLIALIAGGHVLLEGVPGTAKTTLAKAFARVLGLDYRRVQFTPDLLPADVTGAYVFDRQTNIFNFREGPLFCQLLLADEVNRAPAKTQSALLEAMQEHQVTVEGTTFPLPNPFMVLATQNPVEQEGVYRLPEAQLDRFLVRVRLNYPNRNTEIDILKLHTASANGKAMTAGIGPAMPDPIFSAPEILQVQSYLRLVHTEPTVMQYVVDLARASREHPDVALGASPRASLYLLLCAKAAALLDGRHFCTHKDVQDSVVSVLGHRLILLPEVEIEGKTVDETIAEFVKKTPVFDAAIEPKRK